MDSYQRKQILNLPGIMFLHSIFLALVANHGSHLVSVSFLRACQRACCSLDSATCKEDVLAVLDFLFWPDGCFGLSEAGNL